MIKIILIILRIFLGSVFILSAITKLYPIEPLEFSIVEMGFINWTIVPYLSRLLISFEALLGFFLIFNIKTKFISKLTTVVLILFIFYLIYIWYRDGGDVDCGCFGEFLILNTKESIFKNIILLVPSIILIYLSKPFKWKYQKIFITSITIIIISLPFILNTVAYNVHPDGSINNATKFDSEKLGEFSYKNKVYNLSDGKKIVCFFSLTCKYCKLSARKISIINNKLKLNLPIFYVLGGEEEEFSNFWYESKSTEFPYIFLSPTEENNKKFFGLSGQILPVIYLIDNGIIKRKLHFSTLEQSIIEDFINK